MRISIVLLSLFTSTPPVHAFRYHEITDDEYLQLARTATAFCTNHIQATPPQTNGAISFSFAVIDPQLEGSSAVWNSYNECYDPANTKWIPKSVVVTYDPSGTANIGANPPQDVLIPSIGAAQVNFDCAGRVGAVSCPSLTCTPGDTMLEEIGLPVNHFDGSFCPANSWCRLTFGGKESGERQCALFAQEGEVCDQFTPEFDQSRCDPSLTCNLLNPNLPDIGGHCATQCQADNDCGGTHWCRPVKERTWFGPNKPTTIEPPIKVCVAYRTDNESCGDGVAAWEQENCHPSLKCDKSDDGTGASSTNLPGICKPKTTDSSPTETTDTEGSGRDDKAQSNGQSDASESEDSITSSPDTASNAGSPDDTSDGSVTKSSENATDSNDLRQIWVLAIVGITLATIISLLVCTCCCSRPSATETPKIGERMDNTDDENDTMDEELPPPSASPNTKARSSHESHHRNDAMVNENNHDSTAGTQAPSKSLRAGQGDGVCADVLNMEIITPNPEYVAQTEPVV